MSKITKGMRLEAKRLGCKPRELGCFNLDDAKAIDKAIDKAIQEAATYAMEQERRRIYNAVSTRYQKVSVASAASMALGDVLNDIEGPLSGAPTKGAVK